MYLFNFQSFFFCTLVCLVPYILELSRDVRDITRRIATILDQISTLKQEVEILKQDKIEKVTENLAEVQTQTNEGQLFPPGSYGMQ